MPFKLALSLLCLLVTANTIAKDKASEDQFTRLSKATTSLPSNLLLVSSQLDTPDSQIPDPSALNYGYPKPVPVSKLAVKPRPLTNSLSLINSLPLDSKQAVKANPTKSTITLVQVDKSKRRMYLLSGDEIVREYRIALGEKPKGHKQFEGDNRTPEGRYILEYVTEDSSFYRSVHISYPNYRDTQEAKKLGELAGGNIKIHGLKNGEPRSPLFIQSFDWTNGCIAITNDQLDDFINLVEMGTPINIEW